VYSNTGALLGQWIPQNIGKPEGVTVWGNDLWFVDPNQDRVFKFTGGANIRSGKVNATSSFALNSGNLNSTDIVSDGAHLWVLNDTLAADKVFRYSSAGVLEGSWNLSTTNPTPTGITLDPTNVNHLWVVDASTDRVYQYDNGTTRLTGSQEPSISFALAATNTDPQGIADPLPVASSPQGSLIANTPAPVVAEKQHASPKASRVAIDNIMAVWEPVALPQVNHWLLNILGSDESDSETEHSESHVEHCLDEYFSKLNTNS
jgi:hypothetical protein